MTFTAKVKKFVRGDGARDDSAGMQFLIPGWKFDPKRPCLVR